jgi:ABC-2 type transport system permease protein
MAAAPRRCGWQAVGWRSAIRACHGRRLVALFTLVLLGSSTFFVESALGVFDVYLALFSILSGYLIPLELMPAWVGRIAWWSPFDSMLAFPLETLLGLRDVETAARDLGKQWAYIAVMAATGLTVWRRGVKRYVAFGA